MPKNNIAGTWQLVSAQSDPQGANAPLFGAQPSGLLIFTEDLHFAEVLRNPAVPSFAADNPNQGTDAENKAAMTGGLGISGTYTVDEDGNFYSERVLNTTFPNWNGLARDRRQLTLTLEGNRMTERLADPGKPLTLIIWERVQ